MVRFAKIAAQAAVFTGLLMAASAQAASSPPNLLDSPAFATNTSPDINLGEYLQGDYIQADVFRGTYLKAGFIQETGIIRVAETRVAQATREQTAALPMGTIRLRVIPEIGGATMNENIQWRVTTFGRDSAGNRPMVAEVSGSTPELVLPAGWYVVNAQVAGGTIKHPVEVTAGRTFKYTLVKN
jgi:hypothetical protein